MRGAIGIMIIRMIINKIGIILVIAVVMIIMMIGTMIMTSLVKKIFEYRPHHRWEPRLLCSERGRCSDSRPLRARAAGAMKSVAVRGLHGEDLPGYYYSTRSAHSAAPSCGHKKVIGAS